MEDSCITLGMMGGWELLIVLGIGALFVALNVLLVLSLLAFLRSRQQSSAGSTASTAKLATCPRCGTLLPADAPQGLCPRCVLQVGLGTQDRSDPAFRDASGKPNPPDPAELARHFPQLEILELLGQGGMGAVYKARQKDLDRIVALKVLPGGAGGDPAFAERFMREARALARLNHPNIVAVHDFGQIQRGAAVPVASASGQSNGGSGEAGGTPALLYYFIMEFIDGPNLRQLMQTRRLEPREAMSIVPRICEALQYAHDEGIVHRDIKPENILLDTKGRVKIADFGIAKIAGKGRDGSLTGEKDVIGTPHYMAPEQVERPAEVDHRADIYSLGVVFYEMLTGELPLGKFEVPSRKVQVDVRLDEVVLHSLEKEPARRYQHASEVRTDVESIAAGAGKAQSGSPDADATQRIPQAATPRQSWFAPLMVVRGGQRVIHWPGVAQDTFLLAGIYAVCWLFAVLLISPFTGTPHVAALFGGMLGFLAALLAVGFYRSSKTATHRLRNVDSPSEGIKPRGGRWQPIAAALLLVGCVLLWGLAGFVTYVLPMIIERFASQDAELPALMRLMFQVGTVARGFEVVLVPLLILVTAGALVWLFLSSTQPPRQTPSSSQSGESDGSRILRGMGLIAARWTARILGTLLLLFYGTFIVAEGLPPIAAQSVGAQLNFVALGLMLGGFAVGWKREGTAALLITSGWTLWHISEGRIDLNLFQTPLPVAALYAFCWWELRGRRTGLLLGTVAALVVALTVGRFALPVNVSVTGTIADAATGAGISTADLTIVRPSEVDRPGGIVPNARSGAEGRFRLHLGWYNPRQQLRITAPGYAALTTNLGPREPGHRHVNRNFELAALTAPRETTTMPDTIPPVVLQTIPESGSTSIDPALKELRVTFSKPMRDGNWSWVDLGDGSFPEMTGEPRYLEDKRTCVLPVKLEPGRTYATWINVDAFTSFQAEDGTPAVPYLLVFKTAAASNSAGGSGTTADTPSMVTVGRDSDAQFTSIQEAIDAVAEGGTVQIGAALYPERLEISKPIRLVGAGWNQTEIGPINAWSPPPVEQLQQMERSFHSATSDAERARLRAEFAHKFQPPVLFIKEAGEVLLEGLKVTEPGVAPDGKLLSGSVIELRRSRLKVRDCAIVGSPANGIMVADGSSAELQGTLIAAVWNRGVVVESGSSAVIRDCDIRNCYYAGITLRGDAQSTIERCWISGAAWHGIRYDHASPRIEGNLIFANARSGIYASGRTKAVVRRNVLFDNEMNGISCWHDNKDLIEGNTFANNRREGMSILGDSSPTIRSNIFSGQLVALSQGYIQGESNSNTLGQPLVLENVFWNNATNWVRPGRTAAGDGWLPEAVVLEDGTQSLIADPQFTDTVRKDFRLKPDSPARRDGIGVADPIPFPSPWPIQPEEQAIIPVDDTRDSAHWQRPGR